MLLSLHTLVRVNKLKLWRIKTMLHTDRNNNFMISWENGYNDSWVSADNKQLQIDGKEVAHITLTNRGQFALTVTFKDGSSIMTFDDKPLVTGIKKGNKFLDAFTIFNYYIKKFVNYVS